MTWALFLGLLVGGIAQTWADASSRSRQGIPGDWVYSSVDRVSRSAINAQGQVAQVATIVVDTATNSATYTWTIEGQVLTYTADSSTSATEIGDGIVAAINANGIVRGKVTAVNAAGTVTITALRAGTIGSFTASDSDAKLTTTESSTAAADASSIEFGRALVRTGLNTAPVGVTYADQETLARVPLSTGFTAQVITLTSVNGTATTKHIRAYEIRHGERVLIVDAEYAGSATEATDATNIAAAFNLAAPANTIIAAVAASVTVTFTAEVPGLEFAIEAEVVTDGDVTIANTTGPDTTTSLRLAWLGISLYSPSDPSSTIGGSNGSYAGNQGVEYAVRGVVWVTSAETPVSNGIVYVETVTGATQGRFYISGSSTRVALGRMAARWERDGLVTADSLAAIRLGA